MDKTNIFNLEFSAQQVNARAIFAGDGSWVKRKNPPPGKIAYSNLLNEKASEVVPNRSTFKIHEPFKNVAFGMARAYLCCHHGNSSPISYSRDQFKVNFSVDIVSNQFKYVILNFFFFFFLIFKIIFNRKIIL